MPDLHPEVLPKNQLKVWRKFQQGIPLPKRLHYYLAGGTALALQIGHRRSLDFDFFTNEPSIAAKTHSWLEQFQNFRVLDRDQGTVRAEIDGVKVSFIGHYRYPLIQNPVRAGTIRLAGIMDIGLMKLLAITHRATLRDYLDLAAILQKYIPLETLLKAGRKKYGPRYNPMLPLRALVSFEDIEMEMPELLDARLKRCWKKILTAAVKDVAG